MPSTACPLSSLIYYRAKPKYTDSKLLLQFVGYQWRNQEFCSVGGGVSTNSVEDRGQREWGCGGGSPLVRGSGGSCSLAQEI